MTLSETLIKILTKASEKVGLFVDWTSQQTTENLIPYAQELCARVVRYEIATSSLWLAICLLGIFCASKLLELGVRKFRECGIYDDDIAWGLLVAFSVFFGFIFFISAICKVSDIITALTLPELTIIKFAKVYLMKMDS